LVSLLSCCRLNFLHYCQLILTAFIQKQVFLTKVVQKCFSTKENEGELSFINLFKTVEVAIVTAHNVPPLTAAFTKHHQAV
jgi:hypothetical protein